MNPHTQAQLNFGHNALPILILLAFVFLLAAARRRRRADGRKVKPAAKAWERAKMPARRSES
jgi:hypothetical protein